MLAVKYMPLKRQLSKAVKPGNDQHAQLLHALFLDESAAFLRVR